MSSDAAITKFAATDGERFVPRLSECSQTPLNLQLEDPICQLLPPISDSVVFTDSTASPPDAASTEPVPCKHFYWKFNHLYALVFVAWSMKPHPTASEEKCDPGYSELLKKLSAHDVFRGLLLPSAAACQARLLQTIMSVQYGTFLKPKLTTFDEMERFVSMSKALFESLPQRKKMQLELMHDIKQEKSSRRKVKLNWEREIKKHTDAWERAQALGNLPAARVACAVSHLQSLSKVPEPLKSSDGGFDVGKLAAWDFENDQPKFVSDDCEEIPAKKAHLETKSPPPVCTSSSRSSCECGETIFCCAPDTSPCQCRFTRHELKKEGIRMEGHCPACHHKRCYHS